MKKIYSLIAIALIGTAAFAQGGRMSMPCNSSLNWSTSSVISTQSLPPTDTLWGTVANWTAANCGGSAGGGYVVGNNGYGDFQKAQSFISTQPTVVYGCIYWFCAKQVTSGNPNSVVKMRVYAMDGTGTVSTGSGAAPNTVMKSDDVPITSCDTSSNLATAYIHTFSTPTYCPTDFAVGFSVVGLVAGDTIGGVYSGNGDAGMIDQSWDEWSDNTWHSFAEPNNWNLNSDIAFFPIVDMQSGIEEMSFINGVKISTYPNPTTDNASVCYELQKDANNVEIKILDATGKVVDVINQGSQKAGSYSVNLDATTLSAGTYYVTLKAGNGQIATTLVIQ